MIVLWLRVIAVLNYLKCVQSLSRCSDLDKSDRDLVKSILQLRKLL